MRIGEIACHKEFLLFSYDVFYSYLSFVRQNAALFGNGLRPILKPFPNKPWSLRVCIASLLKTLWEKEKLLVTSNFSFSHSIFYPFGELSAIVITFEIVVCKLFNLEESKICRLGMG